MYDWGVSQLLVMVAATGGDLPFVYSGSVAFYLSDTVAETLLKVVKNGMEISSNLLLLSSGLDNVMQLTGARESNQLLDSKLLDDSIYTSKKLLEKLHAGRVVVSAEEMHELCDQLNGELVSHRMKYGHDRKNRIRSKHKISHKRLKEAILVLSPVVKAFYDIDDLTAEETYDWIMKNI